MSRLVSQKRRIEVVYPPEPSFESGRPYQRKALQMTPVNIEGLEPVGRIDSDAEAYAAQEVIDEVVALRGLGFRIEVLRYHATSSAALDGIARHKALLSSRALLEADEPLVTGEVTTSLHPEGLALDNVYFSHDPIGTQHSFLGEGHYQVKFGVPLSVPGFAAQEEFLGPSRVSLDEVRAHIVPFDKVAEMRAWAQEHSSQEAVTLSSDAAFLLTYGLGHRALHTSMRP